MNTTNFKRRSEDYDFSEMGKVLRMNGRYSPFIFKNNYRLSENYLQNYSNCIILDFDENFTRKEFKQSANFAYAIGTTKSHMVDKNGLVCERFRAIIPTETAIYLDQSSFADLMLGVFKIFPAADNACKDTARAYSGHIGAEVEIITGELFDWEPIYEKRLEEKEILRKWQAKELSNQPKPKNDGTKADWYRENWLTETMRSKLKIEEKFASGRNNTIYSICRYFKEDLQLTDTEIEQAAYWMNTQGLPDIEVRMILRGLKIQSRSQ